MAISVEGRKWLDSSIGGQAANAVVLLICDQKRAITIDREAVGILQLTLDISGNNRRGTLVRIPRDDAIAQPFGENDPVAVRRGPIGAFSRGRHHGRGHSVNLKAQVFTALGGTA